MTFSISRLKRDDGHSVAVYTWPAPIGQIKAALQITHGMVEHCARYDRLAQALTRAGYLVYASDHLGHGATAQRPEEYGSFGDRGDGFSRLVEDVYAVNRRIASEHPNLPRVLFAHSMGSFVAQEYLFHHSDSLSAAVISGTNTGASKVVKPGRVVAYLEKLRLGGRNRSKLLFQLSLGQYNRRFEPARTSNDWLSRDPVEVDRYNEDPLCGFELTVQAWIDLMGGLISIDELASRARIPKQLPIYLFAGSEDPVGRRGKGPTELAEAYKAQGMSRVTCKIYPGGRHEMLNETNRDQVTNDLIAWLDANLTRSATDTAWQA